MQSNNWKKDRDLLAEAYLNTDGRDEQRDQDPYRNEGKSDFEAEQSDADPFRHQENEDGETVSDFDQFIEKAERFVDAIGDSELEFLMNLGKHQFEILMQVVKDEHGYRNAPRD